MARPTFAKLATTPKPEPEPQAVAEQGEAQPMLPMNAPKVQKSRQGKKSLTVYLSADQVRAVRLMAVRNDRTLEDMAREALNDLLRKYGEHPAT